MNRNVVKISKILGIAFVYFFVFMVSLFVTISLLIRGDDVEVPNLIGKSLNEASPQVARLGLVLRKELGSGGGNYAPGTIYQQFPAPGSMAKEKGVVKVYVASEMAQLVLPDCAGKTMRDAEALLRKNHLRRGNVSFVTCLEAGADVVLQQYPAAGGRAPEGTAVDLLISKGPAEKTYIMPDLIGKEAAKLVPFFESKGLRIAKIEEVSYYGLKPGYVLKQFPAPGHEVGNNNQITIQISK